MMRRRLLLSVLALLALGASAGPAFAALKLKILSATFETHHSPGEPVIFKVIVQNNEPTNQGVELVIVANNITTGEELTLADVGSGIGQVGGNGSTFTFTVDAGLVPPGTYTINFLLLDGFGDRSDQVRGPYALQIGSEEESLRVFPEVIHLGTLPPGRYQHPTPIEVRWSFFQFNRLRQNQPFTIRVYTDNAARYEGIPHALSKVSPAGLVSMDGRYVIPIKCWTLNFGPDLQEMGWDATLAGPPPVDDDIAWIGPPLLEGGRNYGSASWVRVPDLLDMTADPITWRRLVGQDQYDTRFVSDANLTGDYTLRSPFTLYFATETGPTAVEGTYVANLVVELWNP